jgi:hypothetical protein
VLASGDTAVVFTDISPGIGTQWLTQLTGMPGRVTAIRAAAAPSNSSSIFNYDVYSYADTAFTVPSIRVGTQAAPQASYAGAGAIRFRLGRGSSQTLVDTVKAATWTFWSTSPELGR